LREAGQPDALQRLVRPAQVLGALPAEAADVGMAADQNGLQLRRAEGVALVLQQQAAQPRGRARTPLRPRLVEQRDRAGVGRTQPGEHVQQARLAAAVRTEDAPGLARADVEMESIEQDAAGGADANAAQAEHAPAFARARRAHGRTGRRTRSQTNAGTPTIAITAPTGSWVGATSVRAAVSASVRSAPPPRAQAGSARRGSLPSARRTAFGTISPTKPIVPTVVTA